MVLILLGKSCSGKDTVSAELCKENATDRIVTYTTRPRRKGEIDGRSYHFITDHEFTQMIADGEFAEFKEYYPASGGVWRYGSVITDAEINDDRKHVIILTPAGYRDVKKIFPHTDGIYSVYIECDDDILKERLKNRHDDPSEAARRFEADKKNFTGFEDEADIVIDNGIVKPETTAELITELVKEEKRHRRK